MGYHFYFSVYCQTWLTIFKLLKIVSISSAVIKHDLTVEGSVSCLKLSFSFQTLLTRSMIGFSGDDQYRGAGGSSSGSPPASLLVVPQPLTVKPSHPSHLNPHLGGPHSHPPRKYQCKMCPQVSDRLIEFFHSSIEKCQRIIVWSNRAWTCFRKQTFCLVKAGNEKSSTYLRFTFRSEFNCSKV